MASAGYDPRSFLAQMERWSERIPPSTNDGRKVFQQRRRGVMYYMKKMIQIIDYLINHTDHPSNKTRIKSLEQVMGEAVTIYEQVRGAANTC